MCYEDMDMREFRDERSGTDTCHKLECGHAFHTKCIIEFLTKTESKCPCCNKHKTADQKLTEAALSKKLLSEIKRSNKFKAAKEEVIEARDEYTRITKQLKNEAKAWIINRANELKFQENRKYYFNTLSACRASANEVSKSLGSKHVGALLQYVGAGDRFRRNQSTFEEFLFEKQRWWQVYRFKHPRFSMQL
jgi:hypothetical protein